MQLRQIDSAGRYLNVLREEPEEVEALFRDLLIGVTYFFRGSEAFATLEQTVIPEIFKTRLRWSQRFLRKRRARRSLLSSFGRPSKGGFGQWQGLTGN